MLRDAFNEIRLHPGRFVATLLAIAISVGFIAAISISANTEKQALGRSHSLGISTADVIVEGHVEDTEAIPRIIKGVAGVAAVDISQSSPSTLTKGDATVFATKFVLPSETFRWASLKEGRWPNSPTEIALSSDGMAKLQAKLGDQLTTEIKEGPKYTIVGVTNDAKTLFGVTGYVGKDPADHSAGTWIVKTAPGQSAEQIASQLKAALNKQFPSDYTTVKLAETARADSFNSITGGFDIFKYLLFGFAAIAMVVGIITISNTFTILVTQRRRQIGLLRAVGASSGQVQGRLVAEAFLLGLIGSGLGLLLGTAVAALGAVFTGSLFWGMVFSPVELSVAALIGVLATVVSVLGPSLAATRVSPLEALQPVPTATQAKRIGIIRAVVCALFALVGIWLVVQSISDTSKSLLWAVLAGACLSVAVLGAAPLYVSPVLRLLGKIFGFAGPTTRLAAENAARNPRRAAATAVALMLAVGLVVTLQAILSTVRTSALAEINRLFPVDLYVKTVDPLDAGYVDSVRGTEGVKKVVEIPSKQMRVGEFELLSVRNTNPAQVALGLPADLRVPDDAILVNNVQGLPNKVELPGSSGKVSLRVISANKPAPNSSAAVSESTFAKLAGKAENREFWVQLTDRTSASGLNKAMKVLQQGPEGKEISGGAAMAGMLEQVLGVIVIVLTALLGVAVLIALVGVGNTLSLSVLERQRESALLRALGMQRGSLRLMLMLEALLLAVVGIVVGIAAGAFFGWLAVSSVFRMMPGAERVENVLKFSLDPLWTSLLIGTCIAAACLASVLPGRRAANATPTEALAAD